MVMSPSRDPNKVSVFRSQNVDNKGLREAAVDMQRRPAEAKDDDPIIPFGPLPTVSRFGAISRTSKTGYQTTGPVQAMASSQGPATKHITVAGTPLPPPAPMPGSPTFRCMPLLLWRPHSAVENESEICFLSPAHS